MAINKDQPMRPAEIELIDAVNANTAAIDQNLSTAVDTAKKAQETADAAQETAATAQETANTAQAAASTAQETANAKADKFTVSEPITYANDVLGIDVPIREGAAPTAQTNGVQTASIIGGIHEGGHENRASGIFAVAMGEDTQATGTAAIAEGYNTKAGGNYSHAEGNSTFATANYAHAEGYNTKARGVYCHTEGKDSNASGNVSHAEGYGTNASGNYSHAEGNGTNASGNYSHAEGVSCIASGFASHAMGHHTKAIAESQSVFGEYNEEDPNAMSAGRGKYIEIAGNGANETNCSNARTLDWDGTQWTAGDVTCDAVQGNHDNLYSMRAIGAIVASVPTLEYGTSNSVTVQANSHTLVDVTFHGTKTEIPVVFPAIQCPTAGVNLIATVQSVTNSQASICITNLGTTDVDNVTVDYLAISGR